MINKHEYDLELHDQSSLNRIKKLFDSFYVILSILHDDSFEGVTGGASPHYKIKIKVEEEWV